MAGLLTHLCPARSALFGDGPICHGKLNVMQLRAPLEFAYGFPHGGSNFRLCRVAHLATSRLFSPACLVAVALFVTCFHLFHSDAFGQIPWFVHVRPFHQRRMIREQLYGDGVHDGREQTGVTRRADNVHAFAFGEVAVEISEHK